MRPGRRLDMEAMGRLLQPNPAKSMAGTTFHEGFAAGQLGRHPLGIAAEKETVGGPGSNATRYANAGSRGKTDDSRQR